MFEECICKIDKIIKAESDELKKLLKKYGFEESDFTVEQIDLLEVELANLFEDEKKKLLKGTKKAKNLKALEKKVNKNITKDKFEKILIPVLGQVFKDKIETLADKIIMSIDKDLCFEYFSKETTNFIDGWSKDLAKLIKEKNHTDLNKIISDGLKNGESVEKVSIKLQESYSFSRKRARTIAITEMLRAHSYAKNEAFIQSPSVVKVKWKHSGTKGITARKHHVALDGVEVNKGENFVISSANGTFFAKFPRDTSLPACEVVRCHCTHSGVVDKGILGLSKEEKKKLQLEGIELADAIYPVS